MARDRRIDDQTAERLLSGRLAPEDAPPGMSGMASLFAAAAVPADPADPDEALLVAMTAAAASVEPTTRRKQMLAKSRSAKIGAIAFGGVVLLGGTAAATESLPDVVQRPLADVVEDVGLDLPGSSSDVAKAVHAAQLEAEENGVTGRERGMMISKAARDANGSADKGNGDEVDDAAGTEDEAPGRGKSAEAKARAAERRAAQQPETGDVEGADDAEEHGPAPQANSNASEGAANADDGADNRTDPSDRAADEAQEHLEDAQGNRP